MKSKLAGSSFKKMSLVLASLLVLGSTVAHAESCPSTSKMAINIKDGKPGIIDDGSWVGSTTYKEKLPSTYGQGTYFNYVFLWDKNEGEESRVECQYMYNKGGYIVFTKKPKEASKEIVRPEGGLWYSGGIDGETDKNPFYCGPGENKGCTFNIGPDTMALVTQSPF